MHSFGLLRAMPKVALRRAAGLPINFDVVALEVRLRAQLGDGLAIHRDMAFDDQLFGLAPAR